MQKNVFQVRGNKNLKQPDAVIEWTPENILEYKRCMEDPIYFITNYMWVNHVDHGPIIMELRDYQIRYVDALHNNRNTIAMAARQMGKSAIAIAYLLWVALFHESKRIAIVANKAATAKMLMGRLRFAYEKLPQWMQQGVVEWHKMGFVLENGSAIQAYPTSSSGVRGESLSILYWDEMSFVPNNIAEEFWASIFPTLSSGKETKMMISSTPIGYNLFWKMWTEAKDGINGFTPVQMYWYEVEGRDQDWFDQQVQALGTIKAAQEILCSFSGSTFTLIPDKDLQQIAIKLPLEETDSTRIYKMPEKSNSYIITVDTSRGLGNDASAAVVYDVTSLPYEVVAVFQDKDIAPHAYPEVLVELATQYNEAFMLIELNDAGGQVADLIYYDLEYTNVFMSSPARVGKRLDSQLSESGRSKLVGIRTTSSVKRLGCSSLKSIITEQRLLVNDRCILQELGTFVKKSTSYAAESGHHDDLAMNLVLFSWLTQQAIFKELSGTVRRDLFGKSIDAGLTSMPKALLSNKEPTGFEGVPVQPKDAWLFDERLQVGYEFEID